MLPMPNICTVRQQMRMVNELDLLEYFGLGNPSVRKYRQHVSLDPSVTTYFYANMMVGLINGLVKMDKFPYIFPYNFSRLYHRIAIPVPVTSVTISSYQRYELSTNKVPFRELPVVIHYNSINHEQFPKIYRMFYTLNDCIDYCDQVNNEIFRGRCLVRAYNEDINTGYIKPLQFLKEMMSRDTSSIFN